MLDFEQNMIEGFSISGKAKITAKPKPKPFTVQASTARSASPLRTPPKPKTAPRKPAFSIKTQAAIPRIAAKISSPAFKAAPVATQAKVATIMTVAPVLKQAIQAHLALPSPLPKLAIPTLAVQKAREATAANLAINAVSNLIRKPAPVKAAAAIAAHHATPAKAIEAIAPIAHACCCQPQPVMKRVKKHMAKKGFSPNTVEGMLATLHDMNTSLEKAATQRLATYEHNALVKKHKFEHEVLSSLKKLACKLPKCHPVRTQAHLAIFRKAGP